MDFKKQADDTMDFVRELSAEGARLPGSDEEKAASKKIQSKILEATGLTPKTEKFVFAPEGSIGAINKIGVVVCILAAIYYISETAAFLTAFGLVAVLVFAVYQILLYTGKFDFLCKHEVTENIVTELPAKSGKEDFTIYLGAHYDSSWCWKLAAKNPDTALLKTAYGLVGAIILLVFSIIRICNLFGAFDNYFLVRTLMLVLPIVLFPGFYWLTQFTSQDKTLGSPGAMDNLSGIGINMQLMKFFKENPDELPDNIKLVNICFASEEAGLKGSFAYAKAHKDELTAAAKEGKACLLNLDSIADPDYFEAIAGDLWQRTHFDEHLIKLTIDSMEECGAFRGNKKTIINPVGGCDSTPFCRLGVPTLTIAAQNPVSTYYYHTLYDTADRIDVSTFEKGLEVAYTVIKKIAAEKAAE